MLTQDSDVRIIDFGIALVSDSDISRIEGIAGSPSYMSPEQVQSLELTNRSDLYSLGAVMYELLTGSRPFRAGNLQKLLHQIVYATPPPIHTLRKDMSGGAGDRGRHGAAEGPGETLEERAGFRGRADPRAPAAARGQLAHRSPGTVRRPAAPEVLPRVLARGDLGGAAREQLAGLRRRARRSSRKARWTTASTSSSRAAAR